MRNQFNLLIDGISIFQWFRDQAWKYTSTLG